MWSAAAMRVCGGMAAALHIPFQTASDACGEPSIDNRAKGVLSLTIPSRPLLTFSPSQSNNERRGVAWQQAQRNDRQPYVTVSGELNEVEPIPLTTEPYSRRQLVLTSISITTAEFQTRTERLLAEIRTQKLSGVILFDNYYILYFTGFAFIPTERPIAFVMNADGTKAMFVPRLEVEHARAQTGFERVDYYLE
jgi:hypothetical protein